MNTMSEIRWTPEWEHTLVQMFCKGEFRNGCKCTSGEFCPVKSVMESFVVHDCVRFVYMHPQKAMKALSDYMQNAGGDRYAEFEN